MAGCVQFMADCVQVTTGSVQFMAGWLYTVHGWVCTVHSWLAVYSSRLAVYSSWLAVYSSQLVVHSPKGQPSLTPTHGQIWRPRALRLCEQPQGTALSAPDPSPSPIPDVNWTARTTQPTVECSLQRRGPLSPVRPKARTDVILATNWIGSRRPPFLILRLFCLLFTDLIFNLTSFH